MKLRIYYLMTIICLLICNLVFFLYFKSYAKDQVNVMNVDDDYMKEVIASLCSYLSIDGQYLDKTVLLNPLVSKMSGVSDDVLPLERVVMGNKIVLCYSNIACRNCLENQLILLNKLGRKIGKENIVVLTNYVSDDLVIFLYKNKIDLDFYEIVEGELGVLLPDYSSLLFTTVNNQVRNSFLIDSGTEKYSDNFYDYIENKWSK